MQALGWLAMFMPTHQAATRDGDWQRWAGEWLDLWDAIPHTQLWGALWMGLFARLAKHDTAGAT